MCPAGAETGALTGRERPAHESVAAIARPLPGPNERCSLFLDFDQARAELAGIRLGGVP